MTCTYGNAELQYNDNCEVDNKVIVPIVYDFVLECRGFLSHLENLDSTFRNVLVLNVSKFFFKTVKTIRNYNVAKLI